MLSLVPLLVPQEAQAKVASKDLVGSASKDSGLPLDVAKAMAVDQARCQLRSELCWTKAKLVVVCHMASALRVKLEQAQDACTQAGGAEAAWCCIRCFGPLLWHVQA